jgi:addiction module RelE/StbE family toxin
MRVRWTTDAADDLERIGDFIAQNRPEAARGAALSIVERIGTLKTFPHIGRPGRVHGTREIAFPPFPFIAIYEVREEQVVLLRILHGAQQWPPGPMK